MAQPQERLQADDPLPDQTLTKKPISSAVCARPLRTENRQVPTHAAPYEPVLSEQSNLSDAVRGRLRSQNRKRQADNALLYDQVAAKKPKPSNFPPEFYDSLSKVWLTRRALQELDRRNKDRLPSKPTAWVRARSSKLATLIRLAGPDLALLAAAGGPDLSDIHGCLGPTSITRAMASMSSASSRRTPSTKATSVSSKSRRSSAYDTNFEQHLIDHNIYPPLYDFPANREPPKPANWEEIRQALKAPRGSLSPSAVDKSAFEDFQRKNKTKSEGTVMRNVVPLIAGNAPIPNEGHLPFTNLDSITSNTTVSPVPDFFDGAWAGDVDKKVREDLDKIIIPSKKVGVPVAPNFFLEAKGPGGSIEVAVGQAVLDGAYGARIMHALQNYLADEPVYDGNAYAFTSTLHYGYLILYAHHITAPAGPGQRPDQHTTQLKACALTSDNDAWLEGIGAFRNLRTLAKDYRDRFIAAANARARERNATAVDTEKDDQPSSIEADRGSSPLDFYDCQMFAEPGDDDPKAQETQSTQDTNVGLAILDHGFENDTQDQDTEVPSDFTTSVTPSFTSSLSGRRTTPTRPSYPQPRHSPPSPPTPRHHKKRT